MSGDGRPALDIPEAAGLRLAVAATRWHADIVDALVERALAVAGKAGVAAPPVSTRSSCRGSRLRPPPAASTLAA